MENEEKRKQELEELVSLLEGIRGRHTELVTVLIPADTNIYTVIRQLEAEASTAENIKSKATRKNVISAIEMIVRELKKYKSTPQNGLALFSGNTSEKEGQENIQIFTIEPFKPLNVRIYRCDQTFITEPLRNMLSVDEVYGLLVMDRKEATIGVLEGKQIKQLRSLTSGVPGKIRAGGQSAQRFERLTEGLAKEFYKRVAESMKEIFFDMPKLKGILVGGPIPTKEEFLEQGELVTKLKNIVIAVKDLGYTDEQGLKELVELSQNDLVQQELIKETKIVTKFFETLGKYKEKACYGIEKTKLALERGAVQTLLISKKLEKDVSKQLEDLANNIGSEVHIISLETKEGEQFYNLTKGVGAVLRFALE